MEAQDVCLHYENLGDDSSLKLVYPDGGGQGGYFIFLVDQNRKCSLLSWKSKKIQRIVHSSLAAEILSLSNAVDKMFSEICNGGQKDLPIEVITNNQLLYAALYSCKSISENRLKIDMLKEMILRKEIQKVHWVDAKKQLAGVLTKHGTSLRKVKEVLQEGLLP